MAEVLIGVEGRVGRLTLNRPAALNALTLDMVRLVDMALSAWAGDSGISLVLVDAASERAFCAGGDIRALYDAARSEEWDSLATFFREEYRLNAQIARFPKPIIALMDGLAMGGGIGLGSHASHRVVTERSSLAMPECRIGFIPDVGSTYLLGRAPGELGTHVALTGMRLDAADAIACGLADRLVRSSRLVELRARLGDCRSAVDVWRALDAVGEAPGPSRLATARSWIDRCYAGDSAELIVAALRSASETQAHAREIEANSPTSVKITLQALREARRLGRLEPCLDQEFRLALSIIRDPNFAEGIRAAVVDRDKRPNWIPGRLETVTQDAVERHFRPIGSDELRLAA